MVYGGNEFTIMNKLGVTKEEAELLYQGYFEAFPGVAKWMQEVYDTLETQGYIEYPEFGFIKHLDLPPAELEMQDSRAYTRQYKAALRTCQNALIQGWCAFVMKKALVDIEAKLRAHGLNEDDASVILQVHDEAVVLCKEEYAPFVGQIMSETMSREFRGVQLSASPEYRRTLSKSAPRVEFAQTEE